MIEYDVDYGYFEECDALDELDEVVLNDENGGHDPIAYVRKDQAPADTSDGYHTFDELYEHRTGLLAALCNVIVSWLCYAGVPASHVMEHVFKSRAHDDGSMFEGMFIVGINCAEPGEPAKWATWHCEGEWWDRIGVPSLDRAPEFDGHTPADALERLLHAFAQNWGEA